MGSFFQAAIHAEQKSQKTRESVTPDLFVFIRGRLSSLLNPERRHFLRRAPDPNKNPEKTENLSRQLHLRSIAALFRICPQPQRPSGPDTTLVQIRNCTPVRVASAGKAKTAVG